MYLHWFGKALKETSCSLQGLCAHDHHVHLLLTPKKAATVRKLVISLGPRYVHYINRQYRRTGALWHPRYKSSLIQAETHLFTYMRYIELNPVVRRWWTIRRTHVGPAIEPTPSDSSHRCSALIRSTAWKTLSALAELLRPGSSRGPLLVAALPNRVLLLPTRWLARGSGVRMPPTGLFMPATGLFMPAIGPFMRATGLFTPPSRPGKRASEPLLPGSEALDRASERLLPASEPWKGVSGIVKPVTEEVGRAPRLRGAARVRKPAS